MTTCNRRSFLTAALGAAATIPAFAQQPAAGTPAPRDWSGQTPIRYPDPDVVVVDNRFRKYVVGNTTIKRVYTGTLWAEGPAWNGVGRFLVWSDIPNNVQMRWTEEDGRVTVFRNPSGYSNGNTFDFEGRQLSCEHGNRRVARYEYNGTVTVIADKFGGKRLNSPNDIVVHPDGGIWFTDPTYGIQGNYEGFQATPEIKPAVYRVDPKSAQIEKDHGRTRPAQRHLLFARLQEGVYRGHRFRPRDQSVRSGWHNKLRNGKRFVQFSNGAADGMRCDVDGNLWAGAPPGVQIVAPSGEPIGMIRLPENCANVCFGGTKRNRLFMAASQSLFTVYVGTTGAHIA